MTAGSHENATRRVRARTPVLVAALAAVAVPLAFFLFRGPTGRTTAAQPGASARPWATRAGALGSAGCSAAGCHGGPLDGPGGRSASAATLWFARDPHARAFDALRSELARGIARRLAAGAALIDADRDPRCLACHTNPATVLTADGALDGSVHALAVRSEGVGCESCHGPSVKWAVPHTTWFAEAERRPAAYAAHGLVWLNALPVRARVCAGCHVGAPADPTDRVPRRDVTHAMIAAGHPRLAFEFASYTQALPPHWVEFDRARPSADRRGPERAAREWLVGQAVCGEALFRLVATHPEWPEFARQDCYACHHDIDPDNRPARTDRPAFDRWNLSYPLRQLVAQDAALEPVAEALRARRQKPEEVRTAARLAAECLAKWTDDVATADIDARARAAFVAVRGTGVSDDLDWDDAALCALAIEARRRAAPLPAGPRADALARDRDSVRSSLRFTHGFNGSGGYGANRRRDVGKRLNDLFDALVP